MNTKTRSILFMDVSGWSKLGANQIHSYATNALPALSGLLTGHEFVNTWGDAIVATFESAKIAAENALKIQQFFRNSYPESGIPADLSCRVSLHVGEVISCQNPLRNEWDIFGAAVHLAARLEPVTRPGEIFCTDVFARCLAEVKGSAPRAWPLGPLDLAKGFGRVEVFVVTGANAPDPRNHLDVLAESSTATSENKRKELSSKLKASSVHLLEFGCNALKVNGIQDTTIRGRVWIKNGDNFVSIASWPRRERDADNEINLHISDVNRLVIGEAFKTPRVVVRDITESDRSNYTDAIRDFIPPNLQTVLARSIGSQQHGLSLGVVSFDSDVSMYRKWALDEPQEIISKTANILHAILSGK